MANTATTTTPTPTVVDKVGGAVKDTVNQAVTTNSQWLRWVGFIAIVAVGAYLLEHFTLGWF